MRTLLDTGPLVAIINPRDAYHEWVTYQADQLGPPFHTCEAAITEAHFLLSRTATGIRSLHRMIESGRIDLSFSYADHIERVNGLMRTYENVPMSFADACLVRLAEIHDDGRIFTTDGDFRIYRKHRDERIEVLMP